jgi:hypothetical protein
VRAWTAALFTMLGVIVTTTAHDLAFGTQQRAAAQDQPPAEPSVLVSGLSSDQGVRYSITLLRPDGLALRDVHVEAELPPDVAVLEAFDTPGRTAFLGQEGTTLTWSAPELPAAAPVDALAFSLGGSLQDPLTIRVSWGGDISGSSEQSVIPDVARAATPEGVVIIAPAEDAMQAAGDTGVLVGAYADGLIPPGTEIRVRRVGSDENPPADLGDLWWCAGIEIDGLPEGSAVLVVVPARRPLPPDADVRLFARVGDTWIDTGEGAAVTSDGQGLLLVHRGGAIAAGTSPLLQPRVVPLAGTATRVPGVQDGTSNTVVGEATRTPTPAASPTRVPGVQDGTSNTIVVGEATRTPVPSASPTRVPGVQDGTSNTIVVGEATRTPTAAASPTRVPGVQDGTSNTIVVGEATRTPTPAASPTRVSGVQDGTSNTIVVGEATRTPTAAASPTRVPGVQDGTSNTIVVGEATRTPTPALSPTRVPGVQDGTSNTIVVGEATRTPTPAPLLTPSGGFDLRVSHAGPARVGPDLSLTYTTVVGLVAGVKTGASVHIQLPAQLTQVQVSGAGWNCRRLDLFVSCERTDRIQAPAAYPPIITTGVLGSCPASMASRASITIRDAVFENNNSTTTLTRACSGV